jgi:hypothetical protein
MFSLGRMGGIVATERGEEDVDKANVDLEIEQACFSAPNADTNNVSENKVSEDEDDEDSVRAPNPPSTASIPCTPTVPPGNLYVLCCRFWFIRAQLSLLMD